MPDIAVFHPQIVHFVVGLLYVGIVLRLVGLLGRPKWVNPAAAALLVVGTLASVAAVQSGLDAHGPVERLPGAREAVMEHEDWGERTRNIFIVVAGIELLALAFTKKPGIARVLRIGSAIAGLAGGFILYEAAEHGGELVYSYAGGVGTRSGEDEDVSRLLVAGLFNQANLDRRAGRRADAARLTEQLLRVRPTDPELRLAFAQSRLTDLDDPRAALDELATIPVPEGNRSLDVRKNTLAADAYEALGIPDSARIVLTPLVERYPEIMQRINDRLNAIK